MTRLRREIDHFDPRRPVGAATSPPASWYLDPEILALERERVFARHAPPADADSLAAGPVPFRERLDATDWTELRFTARRSYTLACNWKIFVDNYLDGGYHVPSVHPDLAGGLDLGAYRSELDPAGALQSAPARGSERLGAEVLYLWIHPAFMVNRYGPVMDTNLVVPLAVDRTEVVFDFYFRETEGAEARRFIERSIAASDRVQREDVAICESVQQGMGSRFYRPGPYAPVEVAMHHFHRLLHRDLRGD